MHKSYKDRVEELASNYEKACEVAENIDWIDIEEIHLKWRRYGEALGAFVHLYVFPENYIRDNFDSAFIRAELGRLIWMEEGGDDYWKVSVDERKTMLGYENWHCRWYLTYDDLRLKPRTEESLLKDIKYFCEINNVKNEDTDRIFPYIKNAESIELGGDYPGEAVCISIKPNSILLTEYGCWD